MKKAKAVLASTAVWILFCACIYGVGAFYEWSASPANWDSTTRGVSAFFMAVGLYVGLFVAGGYVSDK
jgi:small-conductance mechanosensitive channel